MKNMAPDEQETSHPTNRENRRTQHRNDSRGGNYYYRNHRNPGRFHRHHGEEAVQPNSSHEHPLEDVRQSHRQQNQEFSNRNNGEQANSENSQINHEGDPKRNQQNGHINRKNRRKNEFQSSHRKECSVNDEVLVENKKMECLICYHQSDLFGIGTCLHPVCMECCLRMRIFGELSCPFCRLDTECLYFVSVPTNEKWNLPRQSMTHRDSDTYGVRFESEYAIRRYEHYLEFACKICANKGKTIELKTFESLKHHYLQAHQSSFCNFCCENLKVLPRNRDVYANVELNNHLQSFHPSCSFCGLRFLDDECLWRHRRKEHYFCELCHDEGLVNEFFKNMYQLHRHYALNHIVCQESSCKGLVFRNELDLDVHLVADHGGTRLSSFGYIRKPRHNRHMTNESDPSNDDSSKARPFNQADFPVLATTSIHTHDQPLIWPISSLEINSHEQFPSLSNDPVLTSSEPSTSKRSTWVTGNTTRLFTDLPPESKAQKNSLIMPFRPVDVSREMIDARLKIRRDPLEPKIDKPKPIEDEVEWRNPSKAFLVDSVAVPKISDPNKFTPLTSLRSEATLEMDASRLREFSSPNRTITEKPAPTTLEKAEPLNRSKKLIPIDVRPEEVTQEMIEARLKGLHVMDGPKLEKTTLTVNEKVVLTNPIRTSTTKVNDFLSPPNISESFPHSSQTFQVKDSSSKWNEFGDSIKVPKPPKFDKNLAKQTASLAQNISSSISPPPGLENSTSSPPVPGFDNPK